MWEKTHILQINFKLAYSEPQINKTYSQERLSQNHKTKGIIVKEKCAVILRII